MRVLCKKVNYTRAQCARRGEIYALSTFLSTFLGNGFQGSQGHHKCLWGMQGRLKLLFRYNGKILAAVPRERPGIANRLQVDNESVLLVLCPDCRSVDTDDHGQSKKSIASKALSVADVRDGVANLYSPSVGTCLCKHLCSQSLPLQQRCRKGIRSPAGHSLRSSSHCRRC